MITRLVGWYKRQGLVVRIAMGVFVLLAIVALFLAGPRVSYLEILEMSRGRTKTQRDKELSNYHADQAKSHMAAVKDAVAGRDKYREEDKRLQDEIDAAQKGKGGGQDETRSDADFLNDRYSGPG